MKILCLGGAGKICQESVFDLIQTLNFEQITIADLNQTEAETEIVIEWLSGSRVDFIRMDVNDTQQAIDIMRGYDVVMDGTPISVNKNQHAALLKQVFMGSI